MESPKYKLSDVFAIIDKHDGSLIWFPVEDKSVKAVVAYFLLICGTRVNPKQAQKFLLQGIKRLTEEDFVCRRMLYGDPSCIADVYGIILEDAPWYVKFRLAEKCEYEDTEERSLSYLEEVSFPPPSSPLRTVSGKEIPRGSLVYEKMRKLWIKRA